MSNLEPIFFRKDWGQKDLDSFLKVDVLSGTNLREAARLAGVRLTSARGGNGSFGRYHVVIKGTRIKRYSKLLLESNGNYLKI